jgi:dephospho-CoA kinase
MTIIGLTGKMGSGKDTVGALLIERGYKRLAFADALKATAYDIKRLQDVVFDFGWEKAKRANPEVRRTLQALGVAARDNVKRSIWVDAALEVIDDEDENIVITDVRFPDEAQMVMHLGGTVYRVVRPGYD